MKNKIILAIMLILGGIFILAGCKGEEVKLNQSFVAAPEQLVYDVADDNFESFELTKPTTQDIKIYWYLSDNSLITLGVNNIRGDYKQEKLTYLDENDHSKGAIATYSFVIYETEGDDNSRRSNEKIDVFLKGSNSSGDEIVMLGLKINNKNVLTHILGETFVNSVNILSSKAEEEGEEVLFTVRAVTASGDESEDVTDDVTFVEADPRVTDKARYQGGTYGVFFTYDDIGIEVPVIVNGGEVPINDQKSPGWFDVVIVQPFGWVMSFLSFGGFFAIGILLTTLLIRTIAWPIYASTNNMSFKMNLAQPELQKLQKKYENRKDKESQQRMQMEMMQIYKKHRINFWGCLAPIIQFPIFSAMWQLVRRIMAPGGMFNDSVKDPMLFGIIDLTAGNSMWTWDHILLVALCGISMIALNIIGQRQPKYMKKTVENKPKNPQADQQQRTMKMMMYMMSIMMIFMAFASPNAMAFYWIVGNVFSIGQNLLTKKLNQIRYEKHQAENIYGFELTSKQNKDDKKKIKNAKIIEKKSKKDDNKEINSTDKKRK